MCSTNSYKLDDIDSLSAESVLSIMIDNCLFPFIRQRPFNNIADPQKTPRDIFVSGWNTAPLSVNLDLALRGRRTQFQAGIKILDKLSTNTDEIKPLLTELTEFKEFKETTNINKKEPEKIIFVYSSPKDVTSCVEPIK